VCYTINVEDERGGIKMRRVIQRVEFDGEICEGFRKWEKHGKKRVYLNCVGNGIYVDIAGEKWTLNGVEERTTEDGYVVFDNAVDGKDVKLHMAYEYVLSTSAIKVYRSGEMRKKESIMEKIKEVGLAEYGWDIKEDEDFIKVTMTENGRRLANADATIEKDEGIWILLDTFEEYESREEAIKAAQKIVEERRA
jgi:hypothetical protein